MRILCSVSLSYLSYLSRYLSSFFFVFATISLFFEAFVSLRRRFSLQQDGVEGFFLLSGEERGADFVVNLPLYYTTTLGRARSSDVRIKGKGVKRHHAIIYLYSGSWRLAQASPSAGIYLNDKEITKTIRLKHEDVIQIAKTKFLFFDERKSAKKSGVKYAGISALEKSFSYEQESLPRAASILLTLYLPLAILQVVFMIPSELQTLIPLTVLLSSLFILLLLASGLIWQQLFSFFDGLTYSAFCLLMSLGFVIQIRLSLLNRSMPQTDAWNEHRWLEFLKMDLIKQSIFPILGLIIMPIVIIIVSRTRLLEKLAPLCIVITPILYLATILLGSDIAGTGARLWIVLPLGFSLQLGEFAKISYLLVLAWFFKAKLSFKRQILFFLWAGINFILILLLPDLGSLMILLPLTLLVFTVMTSEYLKTFLLLSMGSFVFFLSYQLLPYVKLRIHGWLTLWTEVNAQNDQIIRGLKAISRGGLFGIGTGRGEPRAIPLASSDMIFSFLVEEQGILLGLAVIVIFMTIWLRGANSFLITRDSFSAALTLGISSYFFIEAAVVVAGCTGLIPLTGVTLPFIARGGSSMLAKYFLAGVLLGLWNRREKGDFTS